MICFQIPKNSRCLKLIWNSNCILHHSVAVGLLIQSHESIQILVQICLFMHQNAHFVLLKTTHRHRSSYTQQRRNAHNPPTFQQDCFVPWNNQKIFFNLPKLLPCLHSHSFYRHSAARSTAAAWLSCSDPAFRSSSWQILKWLFDNIKPSNMSKY